MRSFDNRDVGFLAECIRSNQSKFLFVSTEGKILCETCVDGEFKHRLIRFKLDNVLAALDPNSQLMLLHDKYTCVVLGFDGDKEESSLSTQERAWTIAVNVSESKELLSVLTKLTSGSLSFEALRGLLRGGMSKVLLAQSQQ